MSSLAVALAASKQRQLIGAKTTESIDNTKAFPKTKNSIDVKPQSSSRLSSLQQYNQRHKGAEQLEDGIQKQRNHDYNRTEINEHEASLLHNEATNTRRKQGTKKGTNYAATSSPSTTTTVNDDIPQSPSEIVFLCNVPSDSDDDDDDDEDGKDETNQRSNRRRKNRRRKNRGGKKKGIIKDGDDTPTTTTGVSEMVFVCDIPSSSEDDDDRECNRIGNDVNNGGRNYTSLRGKGGQRGRGRDSIHNNPKFDKGRNISKGGRGDDNPRHNNVPAASQDHATKPTNNSGAMPTPWSARAREMAKNDTVDSSKQSNGAVPQAAPMPTPWSSRADSLKGNISSSSSSSSRGNNQSFHKQNYFSTKDVVPTRFTGISNQTSPATTNTTYNELTNNAAPLKLKSAIIKGRWADVDSDDSD